MNSIYKIIASLAVMLAVAGCCRRHFPPTVTVIDSTRVEVRERLVRDTVTISIPEIHEKIVTRDTASFLENDYAESYAGVSGGFLTHSLSTRPHIEYREVLVPVHDTTIVTKYEKETVQVVPEKKSRGRDMAFGAIACFLFLAAFFYVMVRSINSMR